MCRWAQLPSRTADGFHETGIHVAAAAYMRDRGTKRMMVNCARLMNGERPSQTVCDAPRPPYDEQL